MLEFIDTYRRGSVCGHEQSRIGRNGIPGLKIVKIENGNPVDCGASSEEGALADCASPGEDDDRFIANQFTENCVKISGEQHALGQFHGCP